MFTTASQAFRRQVTVGTAGRTLGDLQYRPTLDNSYYGALVQVDWHTPIGNLTILPAWRYADIDNLTAPGFTIGQREKDDQESVEARLVSENPGFLAYNLGVYYFNENIHNRTSLSLSSAATFSDARYHTESYAAYGRLTANLTHTLRLVGGVRYTHDAKDFGGASTSLTLVCVLPTGCPTAPLLPYTATFAEQPYRPAASGTVVPVSPGAIVSRADTTYAASQGTGKVTWRGAVEWDVAPRSLAYASVESGYRSGGFNAAAGYLTYQPETITAYTVGIKNRFLQNRVQLNLEAFWWDYRNQQLSHVGIDQAGRPANFTQNIGHSRIRGVEAETQIAVTPTTLLTGDVQYLDAKYLSFSYLTPYAAGRPYSGCAVTPNPTVSYTVNCTGQTAYNSPKWTVNLGAQQTIRLDRYQLIVGGDTQYKSGRFVFFDYQPGQYVRPTWTTNAQVAFSPKDERWTIAAFVRNIENDRIVVFAPPVPLANLLPATTTAPRTYGVRLAAKF